MSPHKSKSSLYEKICALRVELERLLDKESTSSINVLKLSKELDKYIESYYKFQGITQNI
ncbi:aspartyl-phosphate phosphatase Spo0E family protein [Clostridium thermosuccinogenes]|uniref:aspartyl-phosphate phosphatase Spo0E family protein n=1 Tax=Clostridium thermosuccinogenes TaxID=84032 RepID=UPI00137ACBAE|nr:aspartyl-phosphate phosphatase Spo0E family protein [Pseudoclostridium thermosuccinogenes]